MQDGSCCGVYGKHSGSTEACAAKEECTACYAPHRFGTEGCAPLPRPLSAPRTRRTRRTRRVRPRGLTPPPSCALADRPYFDAKELAFSELVGRYWTNFASSRDPNVCPDIDRCVCLLTTSYFRCTSTHTLCQVRLDFDGRTGRFAETTATSSALPAVPWPDVSTAKNIVLNADLAGHAAAEGSLYDDARVCALWDQLEEQARSTVEQEAA